MISGRVLGLPRKRDQASLLVSRAEVLWKTRLGGEKLFATAAGTSFSGSTEHEVVRSVEIDVKGAERCRAFRILMLVLPDGVSREERGR